MTDKPASLPQLVALRDALLAWHDKNAAAAADNLIDLLSRDEPKPWTADDLDGTEPSPYISGGEVLYPQVTNNNDTLS